MSTEHEPASQSQSRWTMKAATKTFALVLVAIAVVMALATVYGIGNPQLAGSVGGGLLILAFILWNA